MSENLNTSTQIASSSKKDYSQFDRKILRLIADGTDTAKDLTEALHVEAQQFISRQGEEFRVVDRRLQALRKKEEISPLRKAGKMCWEITSFTTSR